MTTATEDKMSTTGKDISKLSKVINRLLKFLSKKEKYVIERRFAINKEHETLEQIGRYFQITRERVRQIEKNALEKLQRHALLTDVKVINKLALIIINNSGGLMKEKKLLQTIIKLTEAHNKPATESYIQLALALEAELKHAANSMEYHPFWHTETINQEKIALISEKIYTELKKTGDVMKQDLLAELVKAKLAPKLAVNSSTVKAVFGIDKKLLLVEDKIGLEMWPHINPKNIREKVMYIMQEKKIPLHFLEICQLIREKAFDVKKINPQAVHNELIRNSNFVLIGRGIYALKEWGYQEGTVKDIIYDVLRQHKSLRQDEIVERVLQQRRVKKITILLNLKNKSKFQRVSRGIYKIKK